MRLLFLLLLVILLVDVRLASAEDLVRRVYEWPNSTLEEDWCELIYKDNSESSWTSFKGRVYNHTLFFFQGRVFDGTGGLNCGTGGGCPHSCVIDGTKSVGYRIRSESWSSKFKLEHGKCQNIHDDEWNGGRDEDKNMNDQVSSFAMLTWYRNKSSHSGHYFKCKFWVNADCKGEYFTRGVSGPRKVLVEDVPKQAGTGADFNNHISSYGCWWGNDVEGAGYLVEGGGDDDDEGVTTGNLEPVRTSNTGKIPPGFMLGAMVGVGVATVVAVVVVVIMKRRDQQQRRPQQGEGDHVELN